MEANEKVLKDFFDKDKNPVDNIDDTGKKVTQGCDEVLNFATAVDEQISDILTSLKKFTIASYDYANNYKNEDYLNLEMIDAIKNLALEAMPHKRAYLVIPILKCKIKKAVVETFEQLINDNQELNEMFEFIEKIFYYREYFEDYILSLENIKELDKNQLFDLFKETNEYNELYEIFSNYFYVSYNMVEDGIKYFLFEDKQHEISISLEKKFTIPGFNGLENFQIIFDDTFIYNDGSELKLGDVLNIIAQNLILGKYYGYKENDFIYNISGTNQLTNIQINNWIEFFKELEIDDVLGVDELIETFINFVDVLLALDDREKGFYEQTLNFISPFWVTDIKGIIYNCLNLTYQKFKNDWKNIDFNLILDDIKNRKYTKITEIGKMLNFLEMGKIDIYNLNVYLIFYKAFLGVSNILQFGKVEFDVFKCCEETEECYNTIHITKNNYNLNVVMDYPNAEDFNNSNVFDIKIIQGKKEHYCVDDIIKYEKTRALVFDNFDTARDEFITFCDEMIIEKNEEFNKKYTEAKDYYIYEYQLYLCEHFKNQSVGFDLRYKDSNRAIGSMGVVLHFENKEDLQYYKKIFSSNSKNYFGVSVKVTRYKLDNDTETYKIDYIDFLDLRELIYKKYYDRFQSLFDTFVYKVDEVKTTLLEDIYNYLFN